MFKNFRIASILLIVAALLLGGGCLAMTWLYLSETKKTSELEQQLAELNKLERRHEIDKSIFDQTKDIATAQLEISQEQTKKAEDAAIEANKQKERAESEKQNALDAQAQAELEKRKAELEKRKALDAEKDAKEQRDEAETQRKAAETLRYLALARSLGSQSSQIRSNDPEKADLLAYASYYFTNKYKQRESDLYNSAVFNALTEGSHTKQTWTEHKGATMAISFLEDESDKEDRFVTASAYGEIKRHTFPEATKVLTTEDLYANSKYDFRDVYVSDKGVIFALGHTLDLNHTSYLVVIDGKNHIEEKLLSDIQNPIAICKFNESNDTLILVGTHGFVFYSMERKDLIAGTAKHCDFTIVSVAMKNHRPLLFDSQHRMRTIDGINKMGTPEKLPFDGQVTAYANSSKSGLEAFGTKGGIIYVRNMKTGELLPQLTGHESKVTRLRMNNQRIYSSSLDGKLNLWIINENEKIEPLTLIKTNEWMMNFNFDRTKDRVWTGGQNGTLTKSLISIQKMVDKMEKEILPKRKKFDDEDWNLYIGSDIEKMPLIYEGKEGRK